jgi:mRNA deadenylase 3'-5' endonuclease subunit Ccr4
MIAQEIKLSQAELVILQEVDHFDTHYHPMLCQLDYDVRGLKRSGREQWLVIAFKTS